MSKEEGRVLVGEPCTLHGGAGCLSTHGSREAVATARPAVSEGYRNEKWGWKQGRGVLSEGSFVEELTFCPCPHTYIL